LPLLFQLGFGMTAFRSGLLTCAAAAGAISMKFPAARLIRRFGFRRLLVVNGIAASLSIGALGFLTPSTALLAILPLLFAGGFLRSLQFTAMNAMAYADIDSRGMSDATSLYTVIQQLSLSGGVVVAALVLELVQFWRGEPTLEAGDFAMAFGVVAIAALSSVQMFSSLASNAGASVSGRATRPIGE
jgi:MFS family permease